MNLEAILALIGDLYAQLAAAGRRIAELEAAQRDDPPAPDLRGAARV
jgi:hypothetical protein